MASVFKREDGGSYLAAWFDHTGKRQVKSTRTTDKAAAKRIAAKYEADAALRREGVIDVCEERAAVEGRRPLDEHVADYKIELQSRGNTAKHVRMTIKHIETIIAHCEARTITDLTSAAVRKAVYSIRQAGNPRVKDKSNRKPSSLRTCNAHLRSIKSFVAWLTDQERCPRDTLRKLAAFNEATDRRHVRRELSSEELDYLLAFVRTYTNENHNLPGPDRELIYRLAVGTGFRAKELRSLTPESFALTRAEPTVTVDAAHSKHRRTDVQPIRPDLADRLLEWLKGKPAGKRVFADLPGDTARMLRADLAAARAAWIKEAGRDAKERRRREESDFLAYRNHAREVADFHATRHTFVSALAASGAPVKTVQELARHSTPTLTFGRYAHARSADVGKALAALPDISAADTPQRKAQQSAREIVRPDANNGGETAILKSAIEAASETQVQTQSEVKRDSATLCDKRRWWESNPRWRICNPLP
jgi:integrase